jgi:hypothetical protein
LVRIATVLGAAGRKTCRFRAAKCFELEGIAANFFFELETKSPEDISTRRGDCKGTFAQGS